MPPLALAPGKARIVVAGSIGGVTTANVFHASKGSDIAWTQAELDTLAVAVRTSWVTNFIPLQDADFTLGLVTATDLTTDSGPVGSASGSTPGTKAGTSISSNAALCVTWRITRHYRGGHPRTYFAGMTVGDLTTPNTWIAGTVTAWATAASNFLLDLDSMPPGILGVLSRINNKVPRVTPLFNAFVGSSVDTRVDSQRRRLGPDR